MKKIRNILPFILILLITLVTNLFIFRNWFLASDIIGGDWPFFYKDFLREFTIFPPAWASYQANGLGGESILYALDSYLYFIVSLFTNGLHVPWEIVYKFFFFGLFLVFSYFSSIYLLKTVLPQSSKWNWPPHFISGFIFATNTYILMVVGGGQMGVALAYSIAPLVLATFIKLMHQSVFASQNLKSQISNLKYFIITGLVLALQIMFDARFAYITMGIIILYIVSRLVVVNKKNTSSLRFLPVILIVPIFIALLLHASWILPMLISQKTPIDSVIGDFRSVDSFRFFSFANFPESLSLLHPNWPENIFGKTYFMKPEFLALPILIFSSLLFINSKLNQQSNNSTIIFFALLGLLGAFLAKGANPPFEEINIWMFEHIPGFNILRDPTKFYIMTALSYSVLIPFSLWKISEQVLGITYKVLILTSFLLLWLFLIRPAFFGQLGGTFAKHEVPKEYRLLKDFLHNQPTFFRTLWVPRQNRFTYYSNHHPSIEGATLLSATNSAEMALTLDKEDFPAKLSRLAIKYIIIPYDPFGEIFINDRKYDDRQYQDFITMLNAVSWLKRIDGFGKIIVYETPLPNDHFFLEQGELLSYIAETPTSYTVSLTTDQPSNLIFSENYSRFWRAKIGDTSLSSRKTADNLNAFEIASNGNVQVKINFDLEKYYTIGRIIAGITFLVCIFTLFKLRKHTELA